MLPALDDRVKTLAAIIAPARWAAGPLLLLASQAYAAHGRVVLTTVLHAGNFRDALAVGRLALDWGVNANFSAYTALRTNDTSLMISGDDVSAFGAVVEELIAFKRAHGNVLTSDWVLRQMVRFFANGGHLGLCRAGERMVVVNPDGTLSPCGLVVRDYRTHAQLKREFTARNECSACYTSTRGNSERPARHIFGDHICYLRRRAEGTDDRTDHR